MDPANSISDSGVILLHDESNDVGEQVLMAMMEMLMKSAMMIISVIAMSCMLIRAPPEDGWGRCDVGGAISRADRHSVNTFIFH